MPLWSNPLCEETFYKARNIQEESEKRGHSGVTFIGHILYILKALKQLRFSEPFSPVIIYRNSFPFHCKPQNKKLSSPWPIKIRKYTSDISQVQITFDKYSGSVL